ncbi:hypothetical protein EW146_g734 [Bondarzewia mesenterica]|uniref:Transcription factor spt8 beta-propeller domain-containing protein n=1 Tax=Bondarzewia mesenterica TaxID=1095465 RepID=A0A4S4M6K6_9AGAM|nr:hypothetical protein EW146_g734 [Bondarzewia mesenterica]
MANTDSDSEAQDIEDADFEDGYAEEEVDEDILEAIEAGVEDVTEGDQESDEEESDEADDDDDDDDDEPSRPPPPLPSLIPAKRPSPTAGLPEPDTGAFPRQVSPISNTRSHTFMSLSKYKAPAPPSRPRALSPSRARRAALRPSIMFPRSYTVEAICALPHPGPTHSLAASPCMLHMLTGSEDGYVRDYDIFSAVNGKVFLTAPQRHHAGVVEGIMKAGQIRSWWENPSRSPDGGTVELSPVYSLAIQSDALWGLAGAKVGSVDPPLHLPSGNINLFTVRHEPGRLFKCMSGHRAPVSALSLQHDEKGFFSASWDGDALQWDLNTGEVVRRFTAHGAQLAALAVRPLAWDYASPSQADQMTHHVHIRPPHDAATGASSTGPLTQASTEDVPVTATTSTINGSAPQTIPPAAEPHAQGQPPANPDAKSDASFDPLFDDEPDAEGEPDTTPPSPVAPPTLSIPTPGPGPTLHLPTPTPAAMRPAGAGASVPKNAPPLLDHASFAAYSPDVLMTAAMDGQVVLWDCRVAVPGPGRGVGRLWMSEKTPPWCLSACWSANGAQIYAGRRNGTIDVWDVRQIGRTGPSEVPRLLKTLRNPLSSGVVSCVAAFPDGRHIACASNDNIRLWNAAEAGEVEGKGRVQFKIIPGHHGGIVSQMVIDPGGRFLNISISPPTHKLSHSPTHPPPCVPSVPPQNAPPVLPQDSHRFFRKVNGRRCNVLNDRYIFPADDDELKEQRFELFHRMLNFVLDGKNYVGPVQDVLSPERAVESGEKLRVLDMGTGGGLWAIDMADEFPHVEVTGVDLAPLQPRFELCDLDRSCLPYPSNSYDVVHARNMHAGIHNYPHFLHELTRILRPGGVLILIESDLRPIADGKLTSSPSKSGIPGWCALADAFRNALTMRGVDVSVPERMANMLADLDVHYDVVRQQQADVPIGFWPKDPTLLTVGQLAWMNWDLLLLAARPLLLSSGLPEWQVKNLIAEAQRDLYHPLVHIASRFYVVHAIKRSM